MKTHFRVIKKWKDSATGEKHIDIYPLCQYARFIKGHKLDIENSTPFYELVTCKNCIRIMRSMRDWE